MHGTIDNPLARHDAPSVDRHARSVDRHARSFDAHPAGTRQREQAQAPTDGPAPVGRFGDEQGSLVTEYGLLAVVAATVAGVIIQWASGGALVTLFNALLRQARALVGA